MLSKTFIFILHKYQTTNKYHWAKGITPSFINVLTNHYFPQHLNFRQRNIEIKHTARYHLMLHTLDFIRRSESITYIRQEKLLTLLKMAGNRLATKA